MKDTQSRYSWFSLVILLIPLVWLIWACLSQIEVLSEIFQVQRREFCEAIGLPFCTSVYASTFEMLGQPENWRLQEALQEFFDGLSVDFSMFTPLSDAIPIVFDRIYLATLILFGHLFQIVFCSFLAIPIFAVTFLKGISIIKIKRLHFKGELPSLMRGKWALLKCLLIATLCVSCCLIHISMEVLMLALGIVTFFVGYFQGIVFETNQS